MGNQSIRIEEYDPAWPGLYRAEEKLIREALGDLVTRMEHIGSTAVPSLAAKPIIDIMVGVHRLDEAEARAGDLEARGYTFRGEHGIAGRLFFEKGVPRSHHIHMVEPDKKFWNDQILFRDFLIAHPGEAEKYAAMKRETARHFKDHREAYTEGKSPFILAALERAKIWRGTS